MEAPRNLMLRLAYDGSGFHGWQRQPGLRTVQGVLEEALSHTLGVETSLEGTSRTDAGVHAMGQCATLRGAFGIPTDRLPVALNGQLSDVCVLSAEERPPAFHARFSALAKTYCYRFAVRSDVPVFLRRYACLLEKRPEVAGMREAASALVGTRDFACFQAAGGTPRETTVRTIFAAQIAEKTGIDPAGNSYELIEFEVTGDGFLYNMVRIMAGTLLETGYGKFAPGEIASMIASKNRAHAGRTAPPQGLYLKEVHFESN